MKISIGKFSAKSGISFVTLKSYVESGLIKAEKRKLGKSNRYSIDDTLIPKALQIRDERVKAVRDKFATFKRKQANSPGNYNGINNKYVLKWLYKLPSKDFKEFQSKFEKLQVARDEIEI